MVLSQGIVKVLKQWFMLLAILPIFTETKPSDAFPEEYVLRITPSCSTLKDDNPSITVVSDLSVAPKAKCANAEVAFQSKDGVNFVLNGTFKKAISTNICQFTQRNNTSIYTVKVTVPWGEDNARIQTQKEFKTVTCVFDDYGAEKSDTTRLLQSGLAPKELSITTGKKVPDADFELLVVNILKKPYVGAIPQGRKIALMAVAKKAVGLHVMSCEVRPSAGSLSGYRLIKAGCGDGRILGTNVGFRTIGKRALSPYFPMFQLNDSETLQFHCNVTICTKACDGSSCAVAKGKNRKRRSADDEELTILISTDHVTVQNIE